MKERFEWIHSWCDETLSGDLPRVLLVGDSITHNYQERVRELLRGVCYVDYISTSYAIDAKIYNHLIYDFMTDSKYDLIHFNNGLHGIHISKRSYKIRLKKLLAKVEKQTKLVLATSTLVYKEGNKRLDGAWMKRVRERNAAMQELAAEKGYGLDDLYPVSVSVPKELRYVDGTHYLKEGYDMLAETVAACIRKNLEK
ncbi:MAG: SGNH/GDSL hydrolase family protein [Clostridia bacterium]|nr:SGNH/GDSL hydrolase family protein [Clostridia bacterium]